MIFLVDEQLPPALAEWLCGRGLDARHVEEAGLGAAADRVVWAWAVEHKAVIVTKDEDFIIRRSDVQGPQVLWVRTGNTTRRALLSRFETVWPEVAQLLQAGQPIVELR